MPVETTTQGPLVAKKDNRRANETPQRFEIRATPKWLARVQAQADRQGISAAAYIRQATTLKLEQDEATDPELRSDE